jgi:N4-gp56 family major capsid protein
VAVTNPADIDSSVLEAWSSKILRDHRYAGFWGRFVGTAIKQDSELLNKPGDLIHIQVTNPLSGAGVTGDTAALVGNEEKLTSSELKVSPLLYRHAVRVNRRAQKKSIIDLMAEGRSRLSEWGMDKMDTVRFTQFTGTAMPAPLAAEAYTPNYYTVGGTDGTPHVDDVVVGEVLDVASIMSIRTTLEGNRAAPINIDGDGIYALVVHPHALLALKRSTEYRDWVREAHVKGAENPFFKGATALIDGVAVFSNWRVPKVANATSVQVSKGIAFGMDAFVEGLDENTHSESDTFDYGLELGFSYEFAFQPRRALELSSIQVYSSAPAPA